MLFSTISFVISSVRYLVTYCKGDDTTNVSIDPIRFVLTFLFETAILWVCAYLFMDRMHQWIAPNHSPIAVPEDFYDGDDENEDDDVEEEGDGEESVKCPICLESLKSNPTKTKPSIAIMDRCNHLFCVDCLQRHRSSRTIWHWWGRTDCPLCGIPSDASCIWKLKL